ncbi:MAG: PQQ-dependent sugar dehydrogenase [Anaerolineae bacterium]|nr:PQQ-dependent sugar dehydrogenase [Anaerolineae bacterium]
MNFRRISSLLTLMLLVMGVNPALAQPQQPDVPCFWRPSSLDKPWIGPDIPCLEEVTPAGPDGELAYTALAVGPDGTLYAARPLAGEIWAISDSDSDGLPDTPQRLVGGLTLPNALDWYEGSLYVAGGPHVYRIDAGGFATVLVDDLPSGSGYWTGGVVLGAFDASEARIYVGTGAACDTCETGDTGRGAVWSFALDGSDGRIEATGLRQPADLAILDGELWVADSAPASFFSQPNLDEINRLTHGADFGFPRCLGPDTGNCAGVTPPLFQLPTGSTPLGLAVYTSDVIPALTGSLLVALAGSTGQVELRGYTFAQADPETGAVNVVMPQTYDQPGFETTDELNYRTVGFYPARPYGIVVSPLGWVYISLSNGRILVIRPQSEVAY